MTQSDGTAPQPTARTSATTVDAPVTGDITPGRAPRRRRRWRAVVAVLATLAVLLVGATAAAGNYFASQVLVVDHTARYPVTVLEVSGDELTLSRGSETEKPAVLGLVWADGAAVLDASVRVVGDRVVRRMSEPPRGTPRAGTRAAIRMHVWDTDPKTARGLDFDEVTVPGELGGLPAWFVPPTSGSTGTTWVIATHGRNGTRHESLRVLPAIAAAGLPTLVIAYRNDQEAPASPDGYYHLGDTEWRDVAAAVAYARDQGATGVVLYGWSMGGGASLMALRRMPPADAALVRGLVLDSPVVSWAAVLDLQGANRRLPGFLVWTAARFVEWRADLSMRDLDHRRHPVPPVPMLVFVDESERDVPTGPTHEFTRARAGSASVIGTAGGGHTGSWNVYPTGYEAAVTRFLGQLA